MLPHLEYAPCVWQNGERDSLEKVQRKCLAACLIACLGVLMSAGIEDLEIEAGILPLQLRREELEIKIMAKDLGQCSAQTFRS